MTTSIAIIGGGFSGVMALRHLAAHPTPITLHLYEADAASLAKGLAYGTEEMGHLLNVPAAKMGAFPDKVDDFFQWLQKHYPDYGAESFVPRPIYAEYVQHILEEAKTLAQQNGHALEFRFERVTALSAQREVVCGSGSQVYDAVIIATGHYGLRPFMADDPRALLKAWDQQASRQFWQWFETQRWNESSHVVVVGTGLSAVDMLQSLSRRHYPGKITAISRHATFPTVHQLKRQSPPLKPELHTIAATAEGFHDQLEQQMHAAGEDWRTVIDDLRPITNEIWQQFPVEERAQFLRRYFHWWNPLRHRMPVESAALIQRLKDSGQLTVLAAELQQCVADAESVQVQLPGQNLVADALMVTAGFTYRLPEAQGSMASALVDAGIMQPTSFGMGLESGEAGKIAEGMFVVGPLRFGALLETLAVPELRGQARESALAALRACQR